MVVGRFLGGGGGSAGLRKGRCVAPRRGAVRGCHTRAQCGTALARRKGLGRGAASGCARGAAWSCTGALPGVVMGAARAQEAQYVAALGRGVRRRRGAAWGCAGAQRGAAHERSVRLRMSAVWGRACAQHGAAHSGYVGPHVGAAWGGA